MRSLALLSWLALPLLAPAAELVLPQNRTAFYTGEKIALAVAGLDKGKQAKLEIVPTSKTLRALKFTITGDGGTVACTLPGSALAADAYTLQLDGKPAGKLTISSGVRRSPMLLSATVGTPKSAGANFFVSSAFGFGLLDPLGQPLRDIRGRRSSGLQAFDNAVRDDLGSLVYMYWTGYVTHKPFGSEKSWAATDVRTAARLLSLHTAQRLRRFDKNILLVGTLDEPGLSWGRTPAGGMASGFPNWDEEAWYARRGWKYTQDIASRDDADWIKYMTVRCRILKEVNEQAKKDLKSIWPSVTFSTDLYAPQAIMDGTDPLNQQINDVPSSHVFLDWGAGKLGALSGLYLEKSDDPRRKLAHAMNGQLFGATVPQPNQRNAYRLMLNALLAAGLHSNWWLNPTGMKNEDLAWVNEPALRMGALFNAFAPADHDVAVLWSFTEAAMRQKDVAARESKKKTGEQIKLLIASLPDIPGAKDKLVDINAYSVGGNYKEQVVNAHQALARAGYPAHILHERVLKDQLARYKTLVIVGQTFELPPEVRQTIEAWQRKGGKLVVDGTTKVRFHGEIVTKADFVDPAFRWGATFGKAEQQKHPFKNDREASVFLTNFYMDEMARKAAPHMKDALRKTDAKPAIVTDSVHLAAEKHTAGGASLYMVLNAHDKLPDIPENKRHWLYNYAPLEATFTLQGITPGSAVYCISGQDWKKVRAVTDFDKPQKASFEPGEMKLYLVAPKKPGRVWARPRVSAAGIALEVDAMPAPFPFTAVVLGPNGKELSRVQRTTPTTGRGLRCPLFPAGSNLPAGEYLIKVTSPVLGPVIASTIQFAPPVAKLKIEEQPGALIDNRPITAFLARKEPLVVAYGKAHQKVAETLVATLSAQGVKATARPEAEVLRKVAYPRVWNPVADVFSPDVKKPEPKGLVVTSRITLTVGKDGKLVAKTADNKDVAADWRLPQSVVTIAGEGFVDFTGDREKCYEPGVKLAFNERREMTVLNATSKEARTTAAFRQKWAKPWERLTTHVGAYQLPAQLPEAWTTDSHLILLGDSKSSDAAAALQASELLEFQVDGQYPGPGKALVQFAFSPFGLGKDVVFIGASDAAGLAAGVKQLTALLPRK